MLLWPQLVVFDLDHTLWHRPRFRGGPPWAAVDDGLSGVRSSTGEVLDLFPASRLALLELAGAGVPVAVASRMHRPAWALQWLSLLRLEDGGRTAADVIGPVVIRDGPKPNHVREIHRQTQVPFERMLFFDDHADDCRRVEALGCTSVYVPARDKRRGQCGLTEELYRDGLSRYAGLVEAEEAG